MGKRQKQKRIYLTKKDIQVANKPRTIFSIALAIKEMQIKATMRYAYTLGGITKIKH